ncbi:serine hydrolase [uncultured Agrococcus sp.]|uniref:serine hydrolase n=1 Tax=uncultured Agrococcus sp. TaxID=382258 RepID=UPI0025D95EA2|nr:serine hydrolase [uncultured Agrococcus sp.]
MTIDEELQEVFASVGARGSIHVRELGGELREVGHADDEPVVLASVFKIPVAIAFEREVSLGRIDPSERTVVTERFRTGGVGTAGFCDDAEVSWRDLAHLMLTLSDNAATDVIYHRIGAAAIAAVLADLALRDTRIVGCCEDLLAGMGHELGVDWRSAEFAATMSALPASRLRALAALDPQRTSSSTAQEMASVVAAIWNDTAAPPAACARIRSTMSQQVWPHRLTSGFGAGVRVGAKTGTLPGIRNEVGVVTYPDGTRYAVAVFTTADSLDLQLPDVDRSIGRAARIAIDHLRT